MYPLYYYILLPITIKICYFGSLPNIMLISPTNCISQFVVEVKMAQGLPFDTKWWSTWITNKSYLKQWFFWVQNFAKMCVCFFWKGIFFHNIPLFEKIPNLDLKKIYSLHLDFDFSLINILKLVFLLFKHVLKKLTI